MPEKPKFQFFEKILGNRDTTISNIEIHKKRFAELYAEYRKHLSPPVENHEKRVALRTELAKICMSLYEDSSDLDDFQSKIEALLSKIAEESNTDVDHLLQGISERHEPTPIETIWATLKNLKIAVEIKKISESDASGMLISGTNAWGPFFAVRGIVATSGQEIYPNDPSDIDIMMCFNSTSKMNEVINKLVNAKIVNEGELARFEKFLNLYQNDEAEMYSLRSHYQNVEQSIHLLMQNDIEAIGLQNEAHRKDDIGFLRDFRPNYPRNLAIYGGYPMMNLEDGTEQLFKVNLRVVEGDLGYISESPTGGRNEHGTFISLLHFFLQVSPVILFDRDNLLALTAKNLRQNLHKNLNGKPPAFLIREERMMKEMSEAIKQFLVS